MSSKITKVLIEYLESIDDLHQKIKAINELRHLIHEHSPFYDEPVDCVVWVKASSIEANDYNPNVMATVEKKLLTRSIELDGFTQPIVVSSEEAKHIVVDGFHRHQVANSHPSLNKRLKGYLPVTRINRERQGERERISATIRHNRARGKHQITAMSDIVRDLCRLGWKDDQISKELGMSLDEVLRLKQITGLAELFADTEFSEAWTVE
ncbi:IbrB-like domain-containing protein [Yersinia alsatica]|uniref:IbrB-like domain-containing protein n=1 Tax=Yersinia alsatica TaxID=2890317 RepID=UPI0005E069C2|nr:ParB/RepB/Spo0J family partition protein [Yersinia alsatica]CNI45723.1 ParB-like nuclease domain [Yersinia frederiksenii]